MRPDEDHPLWAELGRLEDQWRDQDAPIIRHLKPGLNPHDVDAAFAGLGLRAPAEARIWWSWHDGADQWVRGVEVHADSVGRAYRLISLEEAVATTTMHRGIAEELAAGSEMPPNEMWPPSWFVLSNSLGGQNLVIDTSVFDGWFSPVRPWDWEASGSLLSEPALLSSVTGLVRTWVALLEQRYWRWDQTAGAWQREIPPGFDRLLSRLV